MLSESEIRRFHEEGYLGPYALCRPEEAAAWRETIERDVLSRTGLWTPQPSSPNFSRSHYDRARYSCRHLDSAIVYKICSDPRIVRRAAALLGENLLLWMSHFFVKMPGDPAFPWHQDWYFEPLEPKVNLSAWIALEDATVENGCVQVIPGSQKTQVPYARDHENFFVADPAFFDARAARPMVLKAGEFFIYSESLLHSSAPNNSRKRRMGLVSRITPTSVRVDQGRLFPDHRVIVVAGADGHGLNRSAPPPAA